TPRGDAFRRDSVAPGLGDVVARRGKVGMGESGHEIDSRGYARRRARAIASPRRSLRVTFAARGAGRDAMQAYRMLIDGEWVDAQSKRTFDAMTPATDGVRAKCPDAAAADVDKAVQAARRAFEGWREVTAQERGRILFRL